MTDGYDDAATDPVPGMVPVEQYSFSSYPHYIDTPEQLPMALYELGGHPAESIDYDLGSVGGLPTGEPTPRLTR